MKNENLVPGSVLVHHEYDTIIAVLDYAPNTNKKLKDGEVVKCKVWIDELVLYQLGHRIVLTAHQVQKIVDTYNSWNMKTAMMQYSKSAIEESGYTLTNVDEK